MVAEELEELRKREKEAGYTPDWELDAFMKAEIRKGKKESIVTDLVIKLLGLDVRPMLLFAVLKVLHHKVMPASGLFVWGTCDLSHLQVIMQST